MGCQAINPFQSLLKCIDKEGMFEHTKCKQDAILMPNNDIITKNHQMFVAVLYCNS